MDQNSNSKNKITKRRRGLGLLETVVAFSVLITGTAALMTLVVSASIAREQSEYETIASNLAREGVEISAAKRNANWAGDLSFDDGFFAGGDHTFGAAFDPEAGTWAFASDPGDGAPEFLTDPLAKVYRFASGAHAGLFVQGTPSQPQPAGTDETIYRRLLAFDLICSNGTAEQTIESGASCPAGWSKIGIRVNATVGWSERGRDHSISAIETLYDWR